MAFPVEINHVKAQGIVRITWDDGHVCEYPKMYIRGYCPCALCQGHDSAVEKRFVEVPDAGLVAIEPVGNYAVSFRWSDGHGTGIYTFDYLRLLCPGEQCEKSE